MNNLKGPVATGKNETLTLDRKRVKRHLSTLHEKGELPIRESLLNVCRQSLDVELPDQFVTNLDFQKIFDLIISLTPQSELELLRKMRVEMKQRGWID